MMEIVTYAAGVIVDADFDRILDEYSV